MAGRIGATSQGAGAKVKFALTSCGVRFAMASRPRDRTCACVWPDMAAPALLSIPHATYPLAAGPPLLLLPRRAGARLRGDAAGGLPEGRRRAPRRTRRALRDARPPDRAELQRPQWRPAVRSVAAQALGPDVRHRGQARGRV